MRSKTLRLALLLTVTVICMQPAFPSTVPSTTSSSATTEPTPKTLKEAMREFKSLSKSEKKSRLKEAKKQLKQLKADKKAGKLSKAETELWLLIILCILLPPLAVYLHEGEINTKFWISILLTLLFWLPGVIYALIVVLGEDK
jgi:uncharacterized membrane protein YqaE (UPF0057 family)